MSRRRRVVFPYYYSANKKLFHVVVRIRDVPGALAGVLALLTKEVNLLGSTSYSIGEDAAMFSCFAEALRKSETSEYIQGLLAMSPWVLQSEVSESKNGLLVDSFHTGIQTGTGEPYIIFPTAGLAEVFEKLVKTFGSGGETILYELGRNFGHDRLSVYRTILGAEPRARVEDFAHVFEAMGYGASVIIQNSDGSIRIVVDECFECATPSEIGRTCAFRRGLAAGSFGALLEQETECEEIKCRSKGAKVCEFIVTPRPS
ncbi:MAG TPA: V4R domain-containing protein [Nitrososphaerales archaeon]|nr:V4R domain-containing protein [Nitrososphaerales archaeon]